MHIAILAHALLAVFALEAVAMLAAWLLRRRDYLGGDVERVIPALPGDDLPPEQRGEFVLLRRGRPWDGRIYKF